MGRCAGGSECKGGCLERASTDADRPASSNGRCGGRVSRCQLGLFDQTQTSTMPIVRDSGVYSVPFQSPSPGRRTAGCVCSGAFFPTFLMAGLAEKGGGRREVPASLATINPAQQGRKHPSAPAPTVPLFAQSREQCAWIPGGADPRTVPLGTVPNGTVFRVRASMPASVSPFPR
jgi:hypothetical protein